MPPALWFIAGLTTGVVLVITWALCAAAARGNAP